MKALELLNRIAMEHGLHPRTPVQVTAPAPPPGYDYPGIIVIGDSAEAFNEAPPGAPTCALVCYGANKVSALMRAELLKRADEGRQTVAVVIPAKDASVRRALGEDVAALLHTRYSESASNS